MKGYHACVLSIKEEDCPHCGVVSQRWSACYLESPSGGRQAERRRGKRAQAASIGRVNEFLKQANGLVKIEDILPLFPDFVQIDNFKEAICESLEEYNAQIERLKLEMADATRIADALRSVVCPALHQSRSHLHFPRCF